MLDETFEHQMKLLDLSMENLKLVVEERLWNSIKRNYTSENYTNSILDAIQFIGDVIREKSGIESDGNQLIGAALGGENPKIKLNNLSTETEKNFQKGIESILRGFYSAYRNPRSHSKIQDSEIEAFEVLTFLNHLLKIVDKSTGKFTSELFFRRVFDEDFVQTEKYASLIVMDIPKNKHYEIAVGIFRSKENGKIHNLKLVWDSVIIKLTEEQKAELLDLAAEELRYADTVGAITRCISLFKNSWEQIAEDARLRAENKLIKCLDEAEKSNYGKLNESGIYSSWITSIVKISLLKSEIAQKIFEILDSGDQNRQRFAIDYFSQYFDELEDDIFFTPFKEIFKKELAKGNGVIYSYVMRKYKGEDKVEFNSYLDSFVLANAVDDLPF